MEDGVMDEGRMQKAESEMQPRMVVIKAETRPLPDELEHIGMGLDCAECGCSTSWLPCWNCGGEGGWDGEELMEEDPLWYDADDYRRCDECRGKGGWNYCIECRKIVEVRRDG